LVICSDKISEAFRWGWGILINLKHIFRDMKRNNYLLKTLAVCMISGCSWSLQAQSLALDWAKQIGSTAVLNNNGNAVATDAAGNIYTCGRFSGTTDFDPGPATVNLTASGLTDIYIMKQDGAGQFLWARSIGSYSPSANLNQAVSMVLDAGGNVYTTGIYAGSADFDPGPGTAILNYGGGWSDAFISKLDASGNFVWAKSYSGISEESGSEIVLDDAGNLYAYGNFSGTVDFDPGPGVANMTATQTAGYVTKLDTAGNFVWAKMIAGTGNFLAGGLTIAASGNIYLMGNVADGPVDVDPGTGVTNIQPQGFVDACVIKLDNNGNFGWSRQIGGLFTIAAGIKIAIDKLENIYPAGIYLGGIDFSTAPSMSLSSVADEDIFMAKLDASGNFLWTKSTAGSAGAVAELYSLKTDSHNNLLVGGFFKGTVDFDPGTSTVSKSTPGTNVGNGFFFKLDNSGNFKWVKQIAGQGQSFCRGIATDLSGNIYATGSFIDTADFDPGAGVSNLHTTGGKENIFVARYACTDTTSSVLVEQNGKCSGYVFNGVTYNESGIYTITFPNAAGCDSTVTLNLTIAVFQAAITANQFTLQAAQPYATYQWLKDGNVIAGATGNTYQVTANGAYSLVATNSLACTDTSDVYNVSNFTGIEDVNALAAQISVYPNPASEILFVKAPLSVNLALTDVTGKVLLREEKVKSLQIENLAAGIYFLRITDKDGNILKTEKIIKNK
jgi:hypothetical protein